MAESDAGRRATGTVSTEEAERLSERFRPSWEDDPPTVPREPLAPRADPPAPAPVVAVPAARGQASDDLDWEVPTNPVPEAPPAAADPQLGAQTLKLPAATPTPAGTPTQQAMPAEPRLEPPAPPQEADAFQIDVEELPPESKPSGLGEKYVPKEEGAPPVVLNDDVRAAELGAQAALEAQHRARRAPTIARIKAIELPSALVAAEPNVPPQKSSLGWLLALGAIVALVAGGVVVVFGSAKPSPEPAPPPSTAAAKVTPDTAAPPPPALPTEAAPLAPAAAPPAPTAAASAAPEPAPPSVLPTPAATKPPPSTPTAKPAPAPKAAVAPKAAPAAAKPATKPPGAAPKPAAGKAVIVRDSPF